MSCVEGLAAWRDKVLLAELPERRRWAYLCFSGALFLTLGSHTFVGNVKTSVFMDVVGTAQEPIARSLTLAVLFPLTLLYSISVTWVSSARYLVLGVCLFYAGAFALIAAGLVAHRQSAVLAAWALYYAVETSGVILMPMIWSVVVDVTPAEVAPKAFPIIFFGVQLGGILGSMVSIHVSSLGGEVGLILMQAVCLLPVAALAWRACALATDSDGESAPLLARDARLSDSERGSPAAPAADASKAGKASQPETWQQYLLQGLASGTRGLWLLLSRPYVFGIFWVSYANLVPRTILDYSNSVLVVQAFEQRTDQIRFFGQMQLVINCGTALLTLLGTRPFVEYFGVGRSLLVLPAGMAACVFALCARSSLGMSTFSLVASCILAYGINSPCKEMLYVRTSTDIKYKAKSWSEWYGNQAMKVLGAQVNLWINLDTESCRPHCFRPLATGWSVAAWIALWAAVAFAVGRKHRALEAEDEVVT